MRKFRVWLGVQVAGKDASEEIVEMRDRATDEECEEACSACMDRMIANDLDLDTGWNEIEPKASRKTKRGKGSKS